MKPMIIFKEKKYNDNYEFTKEEIVELVEQAYKAGVEDGEKQTIANYRPNQYGVGGIALTCACDETHNIFADEKTK